MANTLKIKRGTAATIPQGQLAEPLFTTDTYDLYIGKGSGGNQRIQNYIASGTSSQFLKGDGTLDSTSYQPLITAGTTLQYYRGDKTFQTLDTSVVPENGPIYFTEPRVRATVLTGLNLSGGGTIAATDSILTAFGKVQNQISALVGGATYQGTWNASTNTPTLASGTGTKGYYYVVSVAGSTNLDGITDWKIGDWAIFNGTTWDKVDNTDAVSSVNGFTGAVNLGLGNISDVTLSSPTNTQLLRFNGTSSKWENWTPTYISGNQTITLSGDISGSGTTTIATTIGAGKVTNAMLAGSIAASKLVGTDIATVGTITTGIWNGTTIAIADGGTGATTKAAAFNALSPMTTLGDIIYGGASGAGTRLAGNTAASKRFLIQTGDGTNSAAPSWGSIAAGDVPTLNQNTTGSAATLTTARTLTIGATGKTFDGSANVSWSLAEIGAAAALSGTSGRVAYWNSGTTIAADDSLLFSPTSTFAVNNVITAAAGGASSFNLISTINAAANNDILYGVRISPTFNNGAFTGVTQRALGVFGNVYINGTITSGAWNGSVIGSSYGGAGTVSGILKANGSGTVSAAVAGTDYVIPSALSSYLPLSGGTLTGALSGTSATFSGFVGVNGSPATAFPLEAYINSATAYTTSSRGNVLRVYNTNTGANIFAGIELGGAGSANDGLAGINATVTGNGSAALTFYTRDANTFSEKFRIASTGAATFSSSVTAGGDVNIPDGNSLRIGTQLIANRTGNEIRFGSGTAADYLVYYAGAAERMRITSGGDLLVGTTSSTYSAAGRGLIVANGSTTSLYGWSVNGTSKGYLYHNGTNAYLENSHSGGIFDITQVGAGSITFNVNAAERMRITSGGELLINTTTDSGNYKLQVNGNIYAGGGGDLVLSPASSGGNATLYNDNGYFQMDTRLLLNGSIKTSNPNGGTAAEWKLGSRLSGTVSTSTTNYLEVDINGTLYYLAFAVPL